MKKEYNIIIDNSEAGYLFNLNIKDKVTLLKGGSGEKKTLFRNSVRDFNDGVLGINCNTNIILDYTDNNFDPDSEYLQNVDGKIIVLDENSRYFRHKNFGLFIRNSDSYFIIICRKEQVFENKFNNVDYAVSSIYKLYEDNNGVIRNKPMFDVENLNTRTKLDYIICEDSKSGLNFFREVTKDNMVDKNNLFRCKTSEGKGNIFKHVKFLKSINKTCSIVADLCAYGNLVFPLIPFIDGGIADILNIESFEWLILNSGLFGALEIPDDLDRVRHNTLETFYTEYLNHLIDYEKGNELDKVILDNIDLILESADLMYLKNIYKYDYYYLFKNNKQRKKFESLIEKENLTQEEILERAKIFTKESERIAENKNIEELKKLDSF